MARKQTPASSRGRAAATILQLLQRMAGNRAAAEWLRGAVVQRACDCGGTCEHCQANAARSSDAPTFSAFLSGKGSGEPLQRSTREFMETRFAEDFSGVRVHTDAHAARSAEQINAVAYTNGSDIYFAPGQYRPDTHDGQRLLAHELTHVVQQSGLPASTQASLQVSEPNDRYEQEADRVASAVMDERAPSPVPAISPLITGTLQTTKHCVTGKFKDTKQIQVASANPKAQLLTATWDPVNGLGTDFEIRAEFTSLDGDSKKCYYGQYRQFVTATGTRTPAGTQNKEDVIMGGSDIYAKGFYEDIVEVKTGKEKKIYRPGHRNDVFLKLGQKNSVYSDTWNGKYNISGCRFSMTDSPANRAAEKAGDVLTIKALFLGQLIDTCRDDIDETQNTPYDEDKVLDWIAWKVEGTATVPVGWKPPGSKSKTP